MKSAYDAIDREAFYPLTDAVKLIKDRAKAKFDETIEIAMNLGIDPRHADQNVRGVVQLPNGTGKTSATGSAIAANNGPYYGGYRRCGFVRQFDIYGNYIGTIRTCNYY